MENMHPSINLARLKMCLKDNPDFYEWAMPDGDRIGHLLLSENINNAADFEEYIQQRKRHWQGELAETGEHYWMEFIAPSRRYINLCIETLNAAMTKWELAQIALHGEDYFLDLTD